MYGNQILNGLRVVIEEMSDYPVNREFDCTWGFDPNPIRELSTRLERFPQLDVVWGVSWIITSALSIKSLASDSNGSLYVMH
jgi:hypothetical protein